MKKPLLLILIIVLSFASARAQYVTIPDTTFRNFLMNKYPGCFNGAMQMDTGCVSGITAMYLNAYPGRYNITSVDGLQYFKNLNDLRIDQTLIQSVPPFGKRLRTIELTLNFSLTTLPALPDSLYFLDLTGNGLTYLPALPNTLNTLRCAVNNLSSIPTLPPDIYELDCSGNTSIYYLPPLNNLENLLCSQTSLQFVSLPNTLTYLDCHQTGLDIMTYPLPPNLSALLCSQMFLTSLPVLPNSMYILDCSYNPLTALPPLPSSLNQLILSGTNIVCLPALPQSLQSLTTNNLIHCIPNTGSGLQVNGSTTFPVCNVTNNISNCAAFPIVEGNIFYDLNSNGVKDAGEYAKQYGRANLSSGTFSFSNDTGFYQLTANATGTFMLTPTAPALFNAVPASTSITFNTYDTTVHRDIALQPLVTKDSLKVMLTSLGWRARPGFAMSYEVYYQNAGTTNLPATDVVLHYNGSLLTFNAASNAAVTNAGNTLTLHLPTLPVGMSNHFTASFTVSTTAPLGNTLTTDAAMTSGAITSVDTARMLITGAYDPNDKEATPSLTPQQVMNGGYIDYTIRFQNTGTDTAIHVVVTDTLSAQLQSNTFELLSTSHPCIATIEGNVASFQMRNIMLPDSNVNEPASHGFIRFRIKPVNTLVVGNTVPNKAAIYFDYNTPVITNTALTQIISQVVPLKLVAFNGRRTEGNAIHLYWISNNEINTKAFAIEQSFDGRTFTKAGEVRAMGYGNNNYAFDMANPAKGNLFFRLKMMDKDGSFAYSTVVLIKDKDAKAGFVLQQNPVRDKLVMNEIAALLLNTEAVIINSTGTVMKRFVIHSASQAIAVNDLPSGVYYLKTVQGNEKVIISR